MEVRVLAKAKEMEASHIEDQCSKMVCKSAKI
jgi:hypothetical protein